MKNKDNEKVITDELIKRVLSLPIEEKERLLAIWAIKTSNVS